MQKVVKKIYRKYRQARYKILHSIFKLIEKAYNNHWKNEWTRLQNKSQYDRDCYWGEYIRRLRVLQKEKQKHVVPEQDWLYVSSRECDEKIKTEHEPCTVH